MKRRPNEVCQLTNGVRQERIVKLLGEANELRKLRAQADQRTAQLAPALFHEMFGDPRTNPRHLTVIPLAQILEIPPNYGTMLPARSDHGEWLCLGAANIQNGELDLKHPQFVNLSREILPRHTVTEGDLLVAREMGSSLGHLGKCVVLNPGKEKWAFDSNLMRIRANPLHCKPEWLKALLESAGGRQLLLNNTRHSGLPSNIDAKDFARIAVPLPPIDEQANFIMRVAEIRQLQTAQTVSRRRLQHLYQTLLQRAFMYGMV